MALGAEARSVVSAVMREGIALAALGAIVGVIGAVGLGGFIASMLAGVSPADPATLIPVPLGLVGVAALAAFLPARRAARTDPLVVLRND
jgi:ABC-type antimicrobial peptide transport system permease subunit